MVTSDTLCFAVVLLDVVCVRTHTRRYLAKEIPDPWFIITVAQFLILFQSFLLIIQFIITYKPGDMRAH
jgi:hypothetical protein